MTDIGLILQCGGKGERFVPIDIPKPLFPLSWDGETCLGNINEDVPSYVPFYLHIRPEQKEQFDDFREKHDIKRGRYIYQEQETVYDHKGRAVIEKGKLLKTDNGPYSFRESINQMYERGRWGSNYFAVYDGCKVGINWDDVEHAVERLKQEDKAVFSYTKELSEEYFEGKKDFRRYDVVVEKDVLGEMKKCVYNKKHAAYNDITDRSAKALAGLNIFDYHKFLDKTKGLDGSIEEYGNLSHYYRYDITTLLKAFDQDERIFENIPEEHYYPSIKLPSDLEKYWGFKEEKQKRNKIKEAKAREEEKRRHLEHARKWKEKVEARKKKR